MQDQIVSGWGSSLRPLNGVYTPQSVPPFYEKHAIAPLGYHSLKFEPRELSKHRFAISRNMICVA
jgi:hypothetical protein